MQGSATIRRAEDVDEFIDARDIRTRRHKIMLALGLAGFAFEAYYIGVIGAGLGPLTDDLNLSADQVSTFNALGYVATLIAALATGQLADKIGRVKPMVIAKPIALVAAILMAVAPDYGVLLLGRVIAGFAYGVDFGVALAFIAEYMTKRRQSLFNFWQAQWYISTVFAVAITLVVSQLGVGLGVWRWGMATAAVFALVVTVLQAKYMLESPRWLAQRGRYEQARETLETVYEEPVALAEHTEPPVTTEEGRWRDLVHPALLPRTAMMAIVNWMQALQYYGIGFYLPVVAISLFGEGFTMALVGSLVFYVLGIFGGVASIWTGQIFGVRKAAIYGFVIVALMLFVLGTQFGDLPLALQFLVPAIFLFAHAAGPGTAGYTMAAFAYPSRLRGRGSQLATISQGLAGITGLYVFPQLVDAVGTGEAVTIFTIVPLIGLVTCLLIRWEPFEDGPGDDDAGAAPATEPLATPRVQGATG